MSNAFSPSFNEFILHLRPVEVGFEVRIVQTVVLQERVALSCIVQLKRLYSIGLRHLCKRNEKCSEYYLNSSQV